MKITKLLIANRGEIAVRIMRTAREMGILTVAVYSEADRDGRHVRMADEAYLAGPAPAAQSYLNSDKLIEIAERSCADAVHPGYGFFSENAAFARAVEAAGLIWVGPHPGAIEVMGDKVRARQAMAEAAVPIVPGGMQPLEDLVAARNAAAAIGLPIAFKAAGGGGGKGLKVARAAKDLEPAFTSAQREAAAYFKNPVVYAERYLENPKHIELQILADKFGTVLHVGERDCSLQRRHQKLWEEALPPLLPETLRHALRKAGIQAAKAIAYDSAGTIEFLVDRDLFYFLEMNTRIQVEHTVTEMITGLDLIREQLRVASGESLAYGQDALSFSGHAIEVRVNAEDPAHEFVPAPGTITEYREPGGPGVRVDSAARIGSKISPDYDSLIAKLVVWAPDRERAMARLRRAIDEFVVEGVPTTLSFARILCDEPSVLDGSYHTGTLETFAASQPDQESASANAPSTSVEVAVDVEVNEKLYRVRVIDRRPSALRPAPRLMHQRRPQLGAQNDVLSSLHGIVVEVPVREGDAVQQGTLVAVVEAMKMMNEIRAHKNGTVTAVLVRAGETVESRSPLVRIE